MNDTNEKIEKNYYENLIIEFDRDFEQARLELEKNSEFPTIDINALMDNLFEIIQTQEVYSSSSRQSDIDYLLQETYSVGVFNEDVRQYLNACIDIIITSVLKSLHKVGVFINGLQPYNFSEFIDNKTVLLRESKVFSHRDQIYSSMDTESRRDFIF